MNYKNNIFILRNMHKSDDNELIDYTFKKILPKIIIKKIEIQKFIILIIVTKNIIRIYI